MGLPAGRLLQLAAALAALAAATTAAAAVPSVDAALSEVWRPEPASRAASESCPLRSPAVRADAAANLTAAFDAAGFDVVQGTMWIFKHSDLSPDCAAGTHSLTLVLSAPCFDYYESWRNWCTAAAPLGPPRRPGTRGRAMPGYTMRKR